VVSLAVVMLNVLTEEVPQVAHSEGVRCQNRICPKASGIPIVVVEQSSKPRALSNGAFAGIGVGGERCQ
jgi:hypothetical protein